MTQIADEAGARRKRRRATAIVVAGCVLLLVAVAVAQRVVKPGVRVRELETPTGGDSEAYAINDAGRVAGGAVVTDGAGGTAWHAVLWMETGEMRDLGALAGNGSAAYGMNETGQVVGSAAVAPGVSHAFLWTEEDGMRDLGTLGGKRSNAWAINGVGQVVGEAEIADGNRRAFVWTKKKGEMRDLGTLGGDDSVALAINEAGEVVGHSDSTVGKTRPFLWSASGGMRDLGVLPSVMCSALDVNDAGQVAIWVVSANSLVWGAGKTRALGGTGGTERNAAAINKRGEVAGNVIVLHSGEQSAFVWSNTGEARRLEGASWQSQARDINGKGQVVGHRWRPESEGIRVLGRRFFARPEIPRRACVWDPPKGGW